MRAKRAVGGPRIIAGEGVSFTPQSEPSPRRLASGFEALQGPLTTEALHRFSASWLPYNRPSQMRLRPTRRPSSWRQFIPASQNVVILLIGTLVSSSYG